MRNTWQYSRSRRHFVVKKCWLHTAIKKNELVCRDNTSVKTVRGIFYNEYRWAAAHCKRGNERNSPVCMMATIEPIGSNQQIRRKYSQGQLWIQILRSAYIIGHESMMVPGGLKKHRRGKKDASMWYAEAAAGWSARTAVEKSRRNHTTQRENRKMKHSRWHNNRRWVSPMRSKK